MPHRKTRLGLGILVSLLAACTVVPGRTIVLKDGRRYPCLHGTIEKDSYGYRCRGENSPAFKHSEVERIEP